MTLPDAADRCAYVSRRFDEPITSTASQVRRWLLVEQPGPWGRQALFESRMNPVVAGALMRRARELHIRVVLVRRGVSANPDGDVARRWFVVSSEPRRAGTVTGTFSSDRELLDLDVPGALAEAPGSDHPPMFLVCTNGKHDPCCSEFGRPVYRRLLDEVPGELVLECSHIGGDRFAANVVCLPDGVYYGRVAVEEAADLIRRYRRGHLDLDRYRGRSVQRPLEQAAEIALRRSLGVTGIDDVTVLRSDRIGVTGVTGEAPRTHWEVVLEVRQAGTPGEPTTWRAEVERAAAADARNLTCHGSAEQPPTFAVRSLEPHPPPRTEITRDHA